MYILVFLVHMIKNIKDSLYTFYYKRHWWPFWKKIDGVIADGWVQTHYDNSNPVKPQPNIIDVRWIQIYDGTRYELPHGAYIFKWGKDRQVAILSNMSKEANQKIEVH